MQDFNQNIQQLFLIYMNQNINKVETSNRKRKDAYLNSFISKNLLKIQINNFPNRADASGEFYQKKYYIRNQLDLSLIKHRNSIKNQCFPAFQILSQTSNHITVTLKIYGYPVAQEFIKKSHDFSIFSQFISQICKSYQQLEIIYGSFSLSYDKIRADSSGNIVIWPSQNFQQCIKPFVNLQKIDQQRNNSFKKNKNHARNIRQIVLSTIKEKQYGQNWNILYYMLNIIIQKQQFQNINWQKSSKSNELYIQKDLIHIKNCPHQQFTKKLNQFGFAQLTTLDSPIPNNNSRNSKTKKAPAHRFSSFQNQFCKERIIENYRQKSNRKISNFETLQKNIYQASCSNLVKIERQIKVPQFIRQRQKVKNKEIQKATSKNIKSIQNNLKLQNIKMISNQMLKQNRKAIVNIEKISVLLNTKQKQTLLNSSQDQIKILEQKVSLKQVKSLTDLQKDYYFQNKSTQSTIKTFKNLDQCRDQQTYFLSNLTENEQKQLQKDMRILFSSRKTSLDWFNVKKFDQQLYQLLDHQDQTLQRQIMMLMS